jgi:hypothetical protein
MRGQLAPRKALFVNCFARGIDAMELESILGNINAQYANSSHVDLPFEVKALQTESSLGNPAGLAARMGMVHYIRTRIGPARSKRCEFSGQAGFSAASISRPFAVQAGEKSVTGEGDRHGFTSYFKNRQERSDNYKKGVISESYIFDFKRIP